jgi:hypothetical protein
MEDDKKRFVRGSRHTPGPWSVRKIKSVFGVEYRIRDTVGTEVGSALSSIDVPADNTQANAALISTAPELLRVAQSSRELFALILPMFEMIDKLSALDGKDLETRYGPAITQILKTIDLVLVKAEGKP